MNIDVDLAYQIKIAQERRLRIINDFEEDIF